MAEIDVYGFPWAWIVAGLECPESTREAWAGNWGPNNICFRSHISRLRGGEYRVHAWGSDDFGMIVDVNTEEEAREIFGLLLVHEATGDIAIDDTNTGVTVEELEALGFDYF